MQIAILIVAMLLLLVILARLRMVRAPSQNGRQWDRREGSGSTQPFHAVSISPVVNCCPAAHEISAQRFLSEEAPALPLTTCSVEACQCRYIHYSDRRSGAGDRRLGPVEESDESEFWSLRNRRSFHGRRLSEKRPA